MNRCVILKSLIAQTKAQVSVSFSRLFRVSALFGVERTATQYSAPNVDSNPATGARALSERVNGDAGQLVVRSFLDKIEKVAAPGEFRAYSTSDGETVDAFVYIRKGGQLELSGDQFGGLIKIAELEAKLNDLVAELQAHKHGTSPTPDVTFTEFDRADFENTEVIHG